MIEGTNGLLNRLRAIGESNKDIMQRLGKRAVANQKELVPRKTGNLARSIRLARVSDTSALTYAGANYAPFVEYATREHRIVPRTKKALRITSPSVFKSKVFASVDSKEVREEVVGL